MQHFGAIPLSRGKQKKKHLVVRPHRLHVGLLCVTSWFEAQQCVAKHRTLILSDPDHVTHPSVVVFKTHSKLNQLIDLI